MLLCMKGIFCVWKGIGDIKAESCRAHKGRFFPYLNYSAMGQAFVLAIVFIFVLLFWCCISVRPHPFTLVYLSALCSLWLFILFCIFPPKQSSVCKSSCLLQAAHGALHHPDRPGLGGGNAEESDGESQQEGPPATLFSVTGRLWCLWKWNLFLQVHISSRIFLPDQTDVSH